MQSIERIEYITQNFNLLQGLRVVPFGLFILVDAAAYAWLPWYRIWRPLTPLALFGLAVALSILANGYYSRHYGEVRPLQQPSSRLEAATLLAGVVLMVIGGALDRHYQLPLSLFGLAMSAFLLGALYLFNGTLRLHYLALAVIVAALSLLPLTGIVAAAHLFGPDGHYGQITIGLGLIVIGLGDHLLLARTLSPLPEER
ncbi:MAG: hypothetical protein R6X32_13850 [Chloroflexota bacterium]